MWKFDLPKCEELIIASLETSMVLKTQYLTSKCVLRMNNGMHKLRKDRYTWDILDDSTKTLFATDHWLVPQGYMGHYQEPPFCTTNHIIGWVQDRWAEAV